MSLDMDITREVQLALLVFFSILTGAITWSIAASAVRSRFIKKTMAVVHQLLSDEDMDARLVKLARECEAWSKGIGLLQKRLRAAAESEIWDTQSLEDNLRSYESRFKAATAKFFAVVDWAREYDFALRRSSAQDGRISFKDYLAEEAGRPVRPVVPPAWPPVAAEQR